VPWKDVAGGGHSRAFVCVRACAVRACVRVWAGGRAGTGADVVYVDRDVLIIRQNTAGPGVEGAPPLPPPRRRPPARETDERKDRRADG
jgi:hypothetical protein